MREAVLSGLSTKGHQFRVALSQSEFQVFNINEILEAVPSSRHLRDNIGRMEKRLPLRTRRELEFARGEASFLKVCSTA